MSEHSVQFLGRDYLLKQLRSILDLGVAWPRRVGGNISWNVYEGLAKIIDELLWLVRSDGHHLKETQMQAVYFLASDLHHSQNGEMALMPVLNQNPVQVEVNSWSGRTYQHELWVDIQIPRVAAGQSAVTDIAIPVLLPDDLDPSDDTSSQFFHEHFNVYIESDLSPGTTELCLVDPNGQVLFSSASNLVEQRPSNQPKILPRRTTDH